MPDDTETDLAWFSGVLAAASKPPWRVDRQRAAVVTVPAVAAGPVCVVARQPGLGEHCAPGGPADAAAIAALGSVGRELLDIAKSAAACEECDGHLRDDGTRASWDAGAYLAARQRRTAALADLRTALRAARERAR